MKITIADVLKWGPCSDGLDWGRPIIGDGIELDALLKQFDRADWMLWTLYKSGAINIRQMVYLAVVCGRTSLRFVPENEKRPALAYSAAMAWVRRPTSDAAGAARGAASAAWDAASAAWDAANAAWDAAGDAANAAGAAGNAARAAGNAVRAAGNAARAAGNAVRAAGNAARAAGNAARAAGNAAGNMAHKEMCALILAELEKPSFKKLTWPGKGK